MTSGQEGAIRATVERVGRRGEGVATLEGERVFVAYALPGETVNLHRAGERGTLLGVLEPSPERVAPFCPYFGTCGGCAVQHWAPDAYAGWKRGMLVEALARVGLNAAVAPLRDEGGAGRRRATFHARTGADGRLRVGFTEARSHAVVPIEACPILDPRLGCALPAANALATTLAGSGKPLDILVTATDAGMDVDLRGHGPLDAPARGRLAAIAGRHDLARLSNHGTIVLEPRKPVIPIGAARLELPPGAFLQATVAGEDALAAAVIAALRGRRRVADLFSGCGTFSLRVAERAVVHAVDADEPALAALARAARNTPALREVTTAVRDLFRRPLGVDELAAYDAVCLDPPRAGAEAQVRALAASGVELVVSVSCDAGTFARDAAILVAAGFTGGEILPIDQFRHTPHIEIVASFNRPAPKRKRRLLG